MNNWVKIKIYFGLMLLFLCGYSDKCEAQKFVYDIDYLFYFDNREFHSPLSNSQTLMAMRLSPEIGILLNDSAKGEHRLMAGVHYWQPLSNQFRDAKFMPTIYYRYQNKGLKLHFGTVPFIKMAEPLSELYLSDSLSYLNPNIQGALIQYTFKAGYIEMQCDWRGLQSKSQREAFRLIFKGKYQYKLLYLGGIATLNHLANNSDPVVREGVCDFALANPYIGLNFSNIIPMDSLTLQAGFQYSLSRDRTAGTTIEAFGIDADIFLKWKFLGFRNHFYYGQNLFPLYKKYGSLLYQGDPHFQSSLYNRTDFMFFILQKSFVQTYFSWRLLFIKGYRLEHQQLLTLRFNLNNWHKPSRNR